MLVRALLLFTLLTLSGCAGGIRGTTTARSPTEELLISNAAERAVLRFDTTPYVGKRVFVDAQRLTAYDASYLLSALRHNLAETGALLVDDRSDAELVLEPRAGTQAVEDAVWGFGIPSLPLSFFGTSTITPPLTITYRRQHGWTKLQVFSYEADTGAFVARDVVWGRAWSSSFGDDIYPSIIDEYLGDDEDEGDEDSEDE